VRSIAEIVRQQMSWRKCRDEWVSGPCPIWVMSLGRVAGQ
jgi:hypothetical protein